MEKQIHTMLFSFVGNRDPYTNEEEQIPGPILSLLEGHRYDHIYLFCTGSAYTERARTVEEITKSYHPETTFSFVRLDLESPVDYEEILAKLRLTLDKLLPSIDQDSSDIFILTDSGTPQMQTAWFLLAKSGYCRARLLQGIPPQFAGGAYKVKEIRLDSPVLPNITLEGAQEAGAQGAGAQEESGARTEVEQAPGKAAPGESAGVGTGGAQAPGAAPGGEPLVRDDGVWITAGSIRVIGDSPAFKKAFETAVRVAGYADISVLITGETGTGKEVVAQLVHEQSSRKGKPFIPLNCSSISPTLAESELFGFGKGAFTGAQKERMGLFRAADGGTILLDEIGEMPLELQPKLLRVLEAKKVHPIGYDREIDIDVRVLAATNQDLEALIDKGRFRVDLYERLRQVIVTLPPLRERGADIPLLAREFLRQWNQRYHEHKQFSEDLLACLCDYPWPTNVRGLQNAVSHICAVSQSDILSTELLPAEILDYFNRERAQPQFQLSLPQQGLDLKALLYQIEEHFYSQALDRTGGNREQAAGLLGLNPPAFRKALRERFNFGDDAGE